MTQNHDPTAHTPYPGPLGILPLAALSVEDRTMEGELARIVQSESADELYNHIDLTLNGLVINIDLYRELLPAYRLSPLGMAKPDRRFDRTRFTGATYAPAKAASLARFKREAAKAKKVVLLGGGPASGKTTVLRSILPEIDAKSTTVYDTSLTDFSTAAAEIKDALSHGSQVSIYWVFRPFALAVEGMIERAVAEGRYLTLDRMVTLHRGSRNTILSIIRQFPVTESLTIRLLGKEARNDIEIPLDEAASLT